MRFRPLHDRVLVKRFEAEEKSPGGISFPTRRRRSRNRVKSSRLARAAETNQENSRPATSRSAIVCCSANGRGPKSSSTASNT